MIDPKQSNTDDHRLLLLMFCLQIEQKPSNRAIHQDNHVSQISKSIQNHSNYAYNNHYQSNRGPGRGIDNHSPGGRVPSHVAVANQINSNHHQKNSPNQNQNNHQEWRQANNELGRGQEDGIYESGPVVNDGKHSLLQYAILNFRQSTEK